MAATFLLLRNEDYNFLARSSSHVRRGGEAVDGAEWFSSLRELGVGGVCLLRASYWRGLVC